MLNLPGLIVEGMKETDEEQTFTVSVKEEPPDVDCCLLQKLVSNGRKEAFFTDTPMFGKTVTLRMLRQRYKCQACGKTAYGTIPHMHEDHRITMRCFDYICKNGGRRTLLPVSTRTAQGHRRGHAAAIPRARAPGHRVQVINPGEARREDAVKLIYQPHFLLSRIFSGSAAPSAPSRFHRCG